ncbi:hypothetical protein VNO78_00733 [Psophocarpus tetragonolobus]|uniref:Uncharacterized protein n=1 Tax=Psophocarpus tetragonolobus TaxID=3891 RepID=A0AAN9SXE2_PSOTE
MVYWEEDMATSDQTLVCVKQVKQEVADEWDESMPLPGDIIEGFSENCADDDSFSPVKASSELSSQLGKINPPVELLWVHVRRGDSLGKLQARIVQQKGSILQSKYTIQAAADHRHVAHLGDLTIEQCNELQEEISVVLIPRPGEARFGMEIKRTEEGFVCIYSVMRGTSADRAGMRELYEESSANGFLLVISRLQGKSTMPTSACSAGLVHCCDQSEIKNILTSAIDQYETIQLHVMAWPNQTNPSPTPAVGFAALLPPQRRFIILIKQSPS